ncbi:MAG: hypothetical protein M3Q64_02595 [bacterium]|nr:hypothetical protein [bacterium]
MKRIIAIIIIVVAFTGAGVLGYKALGPKATSFIEEGTTPETIPSEILPKGANLNFEPVKGFNKESRLFPYPAVNPAEASPTMGEIMQQ